MAVAAAEFRNGCRAGHIAQALRPMMFQPLRRMAVPGTQRRDELPQVVDMPAPGFFPPAVPRDTCQHPTRTESTADIDVVSLAQVQPTPAAYLGESL